MDKSKNTQPWSASEDTLVVWLVLSCPFSEFSKQAAALPNRSPSEIVERFTVIMNDPELTERVNHESHNDILSYRPVPWTTLETYNLVRLCHQNKRCIPTTFLERFPSMFHPSRTATAITTMDEKLRQKEQSSIESQNAIWRQYQDEIYKFVDNHDLVAFPGSEDPVKDVTEFIKSETDNLLKQEEQTKGLSFDVITSKVEGKWTKKSFAVLVGGTDVRLIESTNVVFGRASPKCKPDVDLAYLNLQSISRRHCAIKLCTDLRFYIECLGAIVIVNGSIFKKGSIVRLHDKDIIDIGGAPFVFVENHSLMDSLRHAK
ncbi:FHA domain containing protein [Trichomonas vaginalis G3]|uniref:FHA domain containing protein n=1 Tax=Trichomonas vaginalis (strain ATCC PRA-98 / G3) TaxID=412133 RepID=A2DD16_TRIV3|nr:G-quadruplex RNA binding [Trichomonas vaginalis G3]EAY21790.1 FHA domain containing protein [Trichomonas vaginalis G3]KAI5522371.1 G-quadruplex RNA binding [Trichomonas vaginalis G3]|eukprot:XP_001582776.1 FHA domain containing protein [Trichomonas vaginalis G3]